MLLLLSKKAARAHAALLLLEKEGVGESSLSVHYIPTKPSSSTRVEHEKKENVSFYAREREPEAG